MKTLTAAILLAICTPTFAVEDPCKDNGGCDPEHGLCWRTGETTSYCTCKAGFKQVEVNGTHACVDINECFEAGACDENSLCENELGTYSCRCRCGYTRGYTGHCLDAAKITGICMMPPRCYHEFYWLRTWWWDIPFKIKYGKQEYFPDLDSEQIRVNPAVKTKGICKCESGFSLNTCGYCEDIDECQEDNNICEGEESVCVNTEGSYYCDCKPGYIMGPCGIKCYATNEPIPVMCENVDLRSLAHSEVEAANASFIRPIVLRNFGRCKRKIRVGATSEQELDLDRDGVIDIRLSWTCVDKSLDGSSSRSILTSYSEEEAKWGPWSCWTVCKATCWGGLQTRVRKCLHGRPGLKGCAGEGSQKRDCYFGRKCNFRIRKNVRSLTEEEIKDLIQAMRNFKRDSTANGFHSSASMHSWPNVCNGKPCRPTGGKMDFLAWQRLFLLQMELGLNKYLKDKTLGIPYWNWLDDDGNIPDILWNKKMHKRINPFINMTVILNDKEPRKTIKRSKKIFSPAIELARAMWDNVTRHLAKPHIMREFSKSLENIMEIVYLAACEEWSDNCEISLANLKFSAFDPLYMFIHSNADRLWAIAQKKMEESGSTTWSSQTALDALDKEGYFGRKLAPFANESVSGHKLLQSINSLRDSYYYQKLMGVKYDDLSNDGFPTDEDDQFDEVGGKALRTGGEERLFIGHYFKNVRKNVYINYYLGDDETPCRDRKVEGKVGSTVLLSTDIVYKNTIPTLLPVETVVRSRLSEDFNVKACYTYEANCTEMCREARGINVMTMPDPMLIYHVKDHPIDIYKFNWSNGRRMANWLINLEAGSHWIYFYGDRARNIVQVPTVSEWISCNRKRGRPVACGRQKGNVCMLPVGIYFLIDGDEDHCRNGLKTVVVTRK